ncbi:MAG TPA: hypothetical protein PLI05_04990 [Methanotrichaceae archaeon]|nr:hypothetical protein [Methanotrichaceae archaeon]HQF16407.1 hypothetical protein [Methanotrichaceae archaeon]HQI90979.1 hypothetical protein [Methanotrichaceae archaeon]
MAKRVIGGARPYRSAWTRCIDPWTWIARRPPLPGRLKKSADDNGDRSRPARMQGFLPPEPGAVDAGGVAA